MASDAKTGGEGRAGKIATALSCIEVHTYRHNILTSSLTYNKFGWSLIFIRRELSSSSSPSSSPPTKAASTSSTASERHASILQIMRSTHAWVASLIIIAHNWNGLCNGCVNWWPRRSNGRAENKRLSADLLWFAKATWRWRCTVIGSHRINPGLTVPCQGRKLQGTCTLINNV